jgi:hypothetical protein
MEAVELCDQLLNFAVRVIKRTGMIKSSKLTALQGETLELIKIFSSSGKTAKQNR